MQISKDELVVLVDKNGDGVLNAPEFRSLVKSLVIELTVNPTVVISTVGTEDQIDTLFKTLDIDGGGKLECREVGIAFAKLKGALHRSKVCMSPKRAACMRLPVRMTPRRAVLRVVVPAAARST